MPVMILTLRILIDTEEKKDCYIDVDIDSTTPLTQLHDAIIKGFSFSGTEIAAFYKSDNDWNKGEEYPQIDMEGNGKSMDTSIGDVISKKGDKLLYIYDFLRMWIFMAEIINTKEGSLDQPKQLLIVGTAPAEDSKPYDFSHEAAPSQGGNEWDDDDDDLYGDSDMMDDDIDPNSLSEYY